MVQVVQKTLDTAVGLVGRTLNGTTQIVNNIIQNPLPVVTMVAATWALGPAGLTQAGIVSSTAGAAALASGAIAASQGKNVGDIAKSALLAYGGSNFANYTGAADFTSAVGNSIGGTAGSAVASGLNNAMFNSTVALLGGKDVGQAFGAGFLGGAAGSVAGSAMNSEVGKSFFGNVKESFGLDDSQMKYIQGAATTMGTAAISGQDPQLALTNYVAQNIANIGKTELGKQFTAAKEAFITSKLDLEQEADNQQQIINKRNALYEEAKPVLDQYTSLADEYKNAASNITTANDYIEKNRGGYDEAMMFYNGDKAAYAKKYGMVFDNDGNLGTIGWDMDSGITFSRSDINDSFGPSQSNIERVNAEANKLKPYTDVIDKYRPTIETLRPKLKELNTKLADYSTKFNGFDANIQASNEKITKLSDTFADRAAEFEKTSKQVGTSLVETATSDIELAEIKRQEEAAREAVRQEEERQNTLRIEAERRAEEARQAEAQRQEQARQEALAEEARQQAAALEAQQKADADLIAEEENTKRIEEERQAEEENNRRIEEERKRQEVLEAEQARQKAQAEADRQAELARTQRDEEERAKAEELRRIAQEEADRQAEIARQAEEENIRRIEEERRKQEEADRQAEEEGRKTEPPNTYGLGTKPLLPGTPQPQVTGNFRPVDANEFWTPPVEVPGEDGGTLTVDPNTGAVDVQPPGAEYDVNDTDIGSEVGSQTVTTSPGEEVIPELEDTTPVYTEPTWEPPTGLPPADTPTGIDNEEGDLGGGAAFNQDEFYRSIGIDPASMKDEPPMSQEDIDAIIRGENVPVHTSTGTVNVFKGKVVPTTPAPKPTTPPPTTQPVTPTVPTDPKNTARDSAISDMLIAALMGGGTNTVQADQPKTNVVQAAPVFDFRNPFNVGFFDQQQDQKNNQNQRGVARIATGGYTDDFLPKEEVSVDEILRILEGR